MTVISGVVAPLLHNKEPVYDPAVKTALPQMLSTATVGMAMVEFTGVAIPLAAGLVHPFIV